MTVEKGGISLWGVLCRSDGKEGVARTYCGTGTCRGEYPYPYLCQSWKGEKALKIRDSRVFYFWRMPFQKGKKIPGPAREGKGAFPLKVKCK